MTKEVILVASDLIFTSKITGTAHALGVPIRVAPSCQTAGELASEATGLAIVDLADAGTGPTELGELRRRLPNEARLIAYGSHVDAARLAEARSAGCDEALPRSTFVERLPDLLRSLRKAEPPPAS